MRTRRWDQPSVPARSGYAQRQVVALRADVVGDHAEPHQHREDPQPRQNPSAASSERRDDEQGDHHAGGTGFAGQPQHRRRHAEGDADRLGEALRGAGHELLVAGESGSDDPDRELSQRAEARAGGHPGDEAVGERHQDPAPSESGHGSAHDHHAGRDGAGGDVVHRVREREESGSCRRHVGTGDTVGP